MFVQEAEICIAGANNDALNPSRHNSQPEVSAELHSLDWLAQELGAVAERMVRTFTVDRQAAFSNLSEEA